jgi:DNA-3-methyladenine glycosylase II
MRTTGFFAVVSAIVAQQVSTASAKAVIKRLREANLTTEQAVINAPEELLIQAGLSRQKRRYVRALSEAAIPWESLEGEDTETVVATLTKVTGIGVWTAEIYAMFSLGHRDAFAAGDMALQIAVADLYKIKTETGRLSEPELRAFSERWSPYRSAAARLFWDAYERKKTGTTTSD